MERSSFFTSLNGDRKYKSEDFATFFGTIVGNGIFPEPATSLQVKAINSDMTVVISPGQAWINGYLYNNTADLTLTLGYPDGNLSRIDTVVIRWDLPNREIKTYAKKGEFAEVPVAPEVERNEDIYELAIAHVFVGRNAMQINQADITDLRMDSTQCGWVTGLIDQIDTSELFAQIQAVIGNSANDIETWLEEVKVHYSEEFYALFDTLRDSIDDDVAGSLLNQIIDLRDRVDNIKGELEGLSSSADKITVTDGGGYFQGDNAELVLQEIGAEVMGSKTLLKTGITNILKRLN